MNGFVIEFFVATTGEDQANYFSHEVNVVSRKHPRETSSLPPGNYRVIDGMLCRVLSGLALEDVRKRLKTTT